MSRSIGVISLVPKYRRYRTPLVVFDDQRRFDDAFFDVARFFDPVRFAAAVLFVEAARFVAVRFEDDLPAGAFFDDAFAEDPFREEDFRDEAFPAAARFVEDPRREDVTSTLSRSTSFEKRFSPSG